MAHIIGLQSFNKIIQESGTALKDIYKVHCRALIHHESNKCKYFSTMRVRGTFPSWISGARLMQRDLLKSQSNSFRKCSIPLREKGGLVNHLVLCNATHASLVGGRQRAWMYIPFSPFSNTCARLDLAILSLLNSLEKYYIHAWKPRSLDWKRRFLISSTVFKNIWTFRKAK